ncbi:Endopolyphosphatase [Coniosporium apollinis]|uniref:Endopolyphosphatase n=1 Tax=Coniosporium apollinis TaxID=61459 RepID=A0ABQ9NQI7_9PEZI|nr:Endopolyphosphatase [Coniosporium apollinis]
MSTHWAVGMWSLGLLLLLGACDALPREGAGKAEVEGLTRSGSGRELHGRFLHVTDFHPDPYYETYSSTEKDVACHRGNGPAGLYGAETSDCDTPLSLVNATFKWIDENIKDTVDFVIWTGDSARHDNDEELPRSEHQIIEQNELLVSKFVEVFGHDENANDTDPTNDFIVPIVPTFGNNDMMPHNIFLEGPNRWTMKYLDVWRQFIPEEQRHQFQRGGWYYTEVIPNRLAVFSLNTMYFFDSNSAVDGCAARTEPGYEHFEWLRIQLQFMRERGMKAMMIGHVPPARTDAKKSWDETCWQKYTLWMRQYRDVVVGSFFGHMNIDHFMLQDFEDIDLSLLSGDVAVSDVRKALDDDGEISAASASDYLIDLRDIWAKIPRASSLDEATADSEEAVSETEYSSFWDRVRQTVAHKKRQKKHKGGKKKKSPHDKIGGPWGERYSMSHVGASVVPNYFPTLRIFEYNVTGLENMFDSAAVEDSITGSASQKSMQDDTLETSEQAENPESESENMESHKSARKLKHKHHFVMPDAPSKSSPPGPAYSPQTLALLGYTQYYANLTYINNDFEDEGLSNLALPSEDDVEHAKWKEGKFKGKRPRDSENPQPRPRKFKFQIEYDTMSDKIYGLKDLTVKNYINLARRIGNFKVEDDGVLERTDSTQQPSDEKPSAGVAKDKDKKDKHKKHKMDHVWFTFVRRAFVDTMDLQDVEEQFGHRSIPREQQTAGAEGTGEL